MRRVWLFLTICGLPIAAAEKNRDWKTGQIAEPDQATGSLHTIAAADRNYLVKGTIGNGVEEIAVGASLHFAVEGKTMFVSLDGKEYRLYVVGERVAPRDPGVSLPPPTTGPAKPALNSPKPVTEAGDSLDNDAVVKMILGGLKEDTVVRVIETRPGKYMLTKDALAGLKAAGVPLNVVAAMSAKMTVRH